MYLTHLYEKLLEETLGTQKAHEIIKKLREASQIKPFMFARKTDPKQLSNIIAHEHPQTIALILSYLDPQQASQILSDLPEEQQAGIAQRIATMERTSPEVLREVERVLEARLSSVAQQDYAVAGGIGTLVDILNNVDRGTEKLILEELELEHPKLVDEIRKRLFIFEDVIGLDNASIQRIIREVDQKDRPWPLKVPAMKYGSGFSAIFLNVLPKCCRRISNLWVLSACGMWRRHSSALSVLSAD